MNRTPSRLFSSLPVVLLLLLAPLSAKNSVWSDGQGGTFKAEPAECLGPFAVFRTSAYQGRRLLFRQLSMEESLRFYEGINKKSPPASRWCDAKGSLSASLVGRLCVPRDGKLVPIDFTQRAEPRVIVLYYGSGWGGQSYETVFKASQVYGRLKRLFGDSFEFVFFGIRHDASAQANVANVTKMPWLVAAYGEQRSISDFARFAPEAGERMLALTRDGVPLLDSSIASTQELARFLDQLSALLNACDPANPLFWTDLGRYQAAIRPVLFAKGNTPPLIVGNPFIVAALRKAGVRRIKATLSVSAEGQVLSAAFDPEAKVPERFRELILKTLASCCAILPGLSDGRPVEGSCCFDLVVKPENERMELDRRWINSIGQNEIKFTSWLLLRPIPVPEESFSSVVGTDEYGITQMSALKVGVDEVSKKSQVSAFNRDFFAGEGVENVAPVAGQRQDIDGVSYFWEAVNSTDGLVNFDNKKRVEFSVGYAYTEFECEKAGTALMGLGSDDGVKIWLNGDLVKDSWVRRNTRIDEDLFPLNLRAGKNRLLLKIQNMKGEWSFFARIRQ
jgi:hypothetical protein